MHRQAAQTRRVAVALALSGALLAGGATGCGNSDDSGSSAATPSGTTKAERQKYAKTKFVANAGLAAGATYQWIVKPYRSGKFKKGADGRKFALVKAGAAGAFAVNRLNAAMKNAKGDPTLSKAVAPLSAGVGDLKNLPSKLKKGDDTGSVVGNFDKTIKELKGAGKSAGADVKNKVPSSSELSLG